jgi:phosphatidylglycerol:prolipoprotein diacylglycerol transferase
LQLDWDFLAKICDRSAMKPIKWRETRGGWGRMFPYFEQPLLRVGDLSFHAFGLLTGLAVVVGAWIYLRRAHRNNIGSSALDWLLWVLGSGFLLSHLVAIAVNEPGMFSNVSTIWEHPWRWINLWDGMSSFGGIVGGMLGAYIYARRQRWSALLLRRHLDALAYSFPFGWAIARFGCYLAHDHPGIRTSSWLAVQYPGGPRFDLGLMDCFLAIAIAILFLNLDRRNRIPGFFFVAFLGLYGPARLLLDELRVEDRWLGLASGQYGAIIVTATALFLWRAWLLNPSVSITASLRNEPAGITSPGSKRS